MPVSLLTRSVLQAHPNLKGERTEREWRKILCRVLVNGSAGRGSGIFGKVDSSGKAMSSGTKTSKAKPTRNFGRLLEVGEEDGLPVLPSRAELESWKSQSAQYWSAVVRQFLNAHHGNAFHCRF